MIRRLVEAHYFQYLGKPNRAQIKFWLRELRTPTLLIESAKNHVAIAKKLVANRPLLKYAISGKQAALKPKNVSKTEFIGCLCAKNSRN